MTATLDGVLHHFHPCQRCGGSGLNRRNKLVDCRPCQGRGYLRMATARVNPTRNGSQRTQP